MKIFYTKNITSAHFKILDAWFRTIMEESFLVNINCTKVLGDCDMSQYTMFIDSSRMSIVYELVEWIRWMFSLDTCFYITHNGSVIHELEDIQLLSRLKNFELKPCGRTNCVHKKMYRALLKNLNLFVSWNGLEVPKYFLHKLNQMGEKLSQESNKATPMILTSGLTQPEIPAPRWLQKFQEFNDKKFDNVQNINSESNYFFLNENSLPETKKGSTPLDRRTALIDKTESNWRAINDSVTQMNGFTDKKMKSNENLSNLEDNLSCPNEINNEGSENCIAGATKRIKGSISNVSPVKNNLKTVQESSKNCKKPNSKKYVKPFSLGEILSNMREEFEKQKTETNMKKCSPSPSSVAFKETDFDEKVATIENSIEPEIKTGKKRKRTRKRKSKKENVDEFISQFLDKNTADYSFDTAQSSCSLRPNHIRFDSDEDDNLMETEYVEDNSKIENETKCDGMSKELNRCNGFVENKPEESVPMVTDNEEIISVECVAENKVPTSGQFLAEEKLIDLGSQPCDSIIRSYSANGNFESENAGPNLSMLQSLKEKFKNAVVIERFY